MVISAGQCTESLGKDAGTRLTNVGLSCVARLSVVRVDEAGLSGAGVGDHPGDSGGHQLHWNAPGLPHQPVPTRCTASQQIFRSRVRAEEGGRNPC